MFRAIAEEHKEKQKEKKAHMKELETKIVDQSLPALSDAVFEKLTKGSEEILTNQKEIDCRCKTVREEWEKLNNELGKWATMINDLDRAVKEIGDVRAWSQQIQAQVQEAVERLDKQ
ncbi:hypothetical protein TVAG_084850 [Trichomonas vaginalis G3]|uniref:Biogenesis of lysosome-related organelles complex 1 subunit 1 n=1 Tax=Trichomonas vaginalis (strain ATCC PRA-98 / G3) TaxID=412133 RepID=A2F3S6_TRIV3|nr:BLOC-1 complex subunit 1 family [Trichomonas vaginalis G3]EAY00448.1 hypothetical protein TVAG_084850 [Trichomonas vaginalis G3]KAI5493482.1 BLOC-1 complex subunit 1 family [Trichomonas vaginalis G3]|eukprot:XP_001313377.1 hypothetical protein [Trichomonas vaginalis G3]